MMKNWLRDRPISVGGENFDDCHKAQITAGVEKNEGVKKNEEAGEKAEATAEVAEEAEAIVEVAKDKAESFAAEVAKEVAETTEENANTEESGENVIAEVPAKKKDHPGIFSN